MRTFSVEGTSPESLEAAMAAAMARVGSQSDQATKVEISIAAATKDNDDLFHVVINVRAHEATDEPDLEEEDETEGEGGRERDSEVQRRRAERISQRVRDEMLYHYRVHPHDMTMDEAEQNTREIIENATLDTTQYAPSLADETERRESGFDSIPADAGTFDTVSEAPSAEMTAAGGESRITMLSREVDEVIGLLSMGFYDPPAPKQPLAAEEPAPGAGLLSPQQEEEERERKARLAEEAAPMPSAPPTLVQPTPGA